MAASTGTMLEARAGLQEAIREGTGLRTLSYVTDKSIPWPCAIVNRGEFDPRYVLTRAAAEVPFSVRIYVGRVAEIAAQKKIDELTDPTGGICSAVEDGDNWPDGTPVQSAWVTLVGEIQETNVAEETLLTCDFDITVVF